MVYSSIVPYGSGNINCSVSGNSLTISISDAGVDEIFATSHEYGVVFVSDTQVPMESTYTSTIFDKCSVYTPSSTVFNWINNTHIVDISSLSGGTYYVYFGGWVEGESYCYRYSTNEGTFTISSRIPGSGTSGDPYRLSTSAHLIELMDNPSTYGYGSYYELEDDINMSGVTCVPIGDSTNKFTGSFDGNGHTISNMSITSSGYSGLFGYCSGAFNIQDIVFKDCTIPSTSGDYNAILVGCITAASGAAISRIECDSCTISSGNNRVGSIAGGVISCTGTVTISDCYIHDGFVTGNSIVGGVVGIGANACGSNQITYDSCTVNREVVITSSNNAGGIAGNASNNSTVNYSDCEVSNSIVNGGTNNVGGIAGFGGTNNSTVNYSACTTSNTYICSTSSFNVGGIFGHLNSGCTSAVSNCVSERNTLYGTQIVGGIIGRSLGTTTVTNPTVSHNNIQGASSVGGVIGQNS